MTPADFRNPNPVGPNGRPINLRAGLQQAPPPDVQRQAVMDQLAPPTAGIPAGGTTPGMPTTGGASPFARGGQVKQLPGAGTAGKIGNLATGIGTEVAGQIAKNVGQNVAKKGVESVAGQVGGRAASLGASAANLGTGMGISIGTDLLANKLRDKEDMPTFGGEFGEYTDDLGRRFQGTGGGMASNAVKYAGYGANPALAGATMGLSVLGGAAAGAIKGAIQKHAGSAYTDFKVEDAANAIKAQYKKELGREASDEEVAAQLKGQGWDPNGGDRWVGEKNLIGKGGVMEQIRSSPEAQQFKQTGKSQIERDALMSQLGAGPTASADLAGRDGKSTAGTAPGSAPSPPLDPGKAAPGSAPAPPLGSEADAPASGADAGGAGADLGDTSAWDTDQYAAPQFVPKSFGDAPPGFDPEKWADPNHQTPKYAVTRILNQFGGTPEGVAKAMPDLEKAYPGATFNGKDKVTIPGVGTIDVVKAAGLGGQGLQWIPEGEEGGGGEAAPGGGGASPTAGGDLGDGGDLLAQLQAEIDRITKGAGPNRGAVMSQLGAEA